MRIDRVVVFFGLTESAGADPIALFKRVGVRSMEININFQFSIAATEREIRQTNGERDWIRQRRTLLAW